MSAGIRVADPGSESSALDMIVKRLEQMNYAVAAVDIDLEMWHECVRKRSLP